MLAKKSTNYKINELNYYFCSSVEKFIISYIFFVDDGGLINLITLEMDWKSKIWKIKFVAFCIDMYMQKSNLVLLNADDYTV